MDQDQDTEDTLVDTQGEIERQEALRALYGDTLGISIAPGSRVADLGCGPGVNLWIAKAIGPQGDYVGVDISPQALQAAGRLAEAQGLDNAIFVEASADETTLPRGTFDVVFIRHLLVHVRGAENVVKEAFRLLKSGGRVIVIEAEDTTAKAGPGKDNLVAAWRAKSLYTVIDRNAVVMDRNRIRDYLRRTRFAERSVEPFVVAANGSNPDRCRALLGDWLSAIERVEGELIEHDVTTPEVIKGAKREAVVVEPDTTAELTLWVGTAKKI